MAPDPISLLQRVAANTGRVPPAGLVGLVYAWVSEAAPEILGGVPPAEAFGLKAQRGAWQNSPRHRATLTRRNDALRALDELAEGNGKERDQQMRTWLDAWRRLNSEPLDGPEARLLLATIPCAAREHLDELEAMDLPGYSAVRRVVRSASHAPEAGQAQVPHGSIIPEAPPLLCNE